MSTSVVEHNLQAVGFQDQVLARVARKVSAQSFNTWFRPLIFAGSDETTAQWIVPNEYFKNALLKNYAPLLQQAIEETAGAPLQLQLSVPAPDASNHCPSTLPLVRASELESAATDHPWLIEDLWTAQAVGIVGGQPKSMKTWLALEMAVAVASATPCLGRFHVHHPGPVLLYAAEDSASSLRGRLRSLAQHHGHGLRDLDINVITADALRLDLQPDQTRLHDTVANIQPVFLLLDPLVRIHNIDENVAAQVAALLGYFRALQRKTGVAVALVHHARKNLSVASAAGNSLRGSSDLYAWLDSLLYLQRRHKQLTLCVEHRSAPGMEPINLELVQSSVADQKGPYLTLSSPDQKRNSSAADPLQDRILQLLSSSLSPMSTDAIRSTLHVRKQRLVEALKSLCTQGKVQRLQHGYSTNINPSPSQ